jgi:uncharacterized protein (DUF488 family)
MLTRQKTVFSLLAQAGRALSPTVFVKLMFLLRQETALRDDPAFYDFVPYQFGPFSFTLYRELGGLRQAGWVAADDRQIALTASGWASVQTQIESLPERVQAAVGQILRRYGGMEPEALMRDVYARYPWYATKSERSDLLPNTLPRPNPAPPAVYTAGYEGKSVDAFLDDLLKKGIQMVIDVRANPVSRKYGFSGARLGEICNKLGLEYRHEPALGIPSAERTGLAGFASYQRLLERYERATLPERSAEVEAVGRLMRQKASVLLCVEKDVRCCHRSRLANAVAKATGMEVVHI